MGVPTRGTVPATKPDKTKKGLFMDSARLSSTHQALGAVLMSASDCH